MVSTKKRFIRPQKGRVIGGVCLAFANYFNIDVVIVRIIWILLLFPGGIPGLVPYLILWAITPSEK